MTKDNKPHVSIEVGASAKAELRAEVPSTSMGRLVDALTDAIRPFTEERGLRADVIRLQREDVLIKIAHKARERIALEALPGGEVPNRVLIPLLEKASWTDPRDQLLIDAWAQLLASASTSPNPNHGLSVDILSKLDSKHVRFLAWLSKNGKKGFFRDAFVAASEQSVRREIDELTVKYEEIRPRLGDDKWVHDLIAEVTAVLDHQGVCVTGGAVSLSKKYEAEDYYEFGSGMTDADLDQSVAEGLASLNLVADVFIESIEVRSGCDIWVHYYCLTHFGGEFVESCTTVASP